MSYIYYQGIELLPVKSDVVFKAVFGREDGRDVLAAFLNGVLDLKIPSPDDITLLNSELAPEFDDDKLSRLDVRIQTKENTHIDIEIQLINRSDMIPRSLYYVSRLYTSQMQKGKRYRDIGKVIALNILDFSLLPYPEYFNRYRLANERTSEPLSDLLEVDFLELSKCERIIPGTCIRDWWAMFLSAQSEEVLKMAAERSEEVGKAVDRLYHASSDESMRKLYEQRRDAELDYYAEIQAKREEGWQTGRQEGAHLERKRTVQFLLKKMAAQEVADLLNLPLTEIQNLAQ